MLNPKGSKFRNDSTNMHYVYEVVGLALEIVVKQMLNLPPEAGPVIISVPVLIISYIVAPQPVKQVTILGVRFSLINLSPCL